VGHQPADDLPPARQLCLEQGKKVFALQTLLPQQDEEARELEAERTPGSVNPMTEPPWNSVL
jgi:hypothetical protein